LRPYGRAKPNILPGIITWVTKHLEPEALSLESLASSLVSVPQSQSPGSRNIRQSARFKRARDASRTGPHSVIFNVIFLYFARPSRRCAVSPEETERLSRRVTAQLLRGTGFCRDPEEPALSVSKDAAKKSSIPGTRVSPSSHNPIRDFHDEPLASNMTLPRYSIFKERRCTAPAPSRRSA